MTSYSDKTIFLELGESTTKVIEAGLVTYEEIEDAQKVFDECVAKVESEWPADRVKEWLIANERSRYAFFKKRRTEIEIENREARMRGKSYQERARYSKQLEALDKLLIETEAKGKAIKRAPAPSARLYITPGSVEFINTRGFEKHLRYATI